MANDYVTVDQVQAPVYATGERFPITTNVGTALAYFEQSGLVALTGVTGAKARLVAPLNDKTWDWFTVLTGIYNVTDHKGRFGSRGAKVNVVAHGQCHPLSRSQRVKEALGTDYTKENGTAQLSEGEVVELLSEEGTPIFTYYDFLEASQDPKFLKNNPSFRIVRTQDILGRTKHGVQPLSTLYDNSSVLCYVGGKSPVQVTTPEGEKTVTVAQALVDRTAQRFNRNDLGIWLHDTEGGRLLVLGYNVNGLCGKNYLYINSRFVGVGTGNTKYVAPRSGDASEQRVVVLNLEQILALGKDLPSATKIQFEESARKLF